MVSPSVLAGNFSKLGKLAIHFFLWSIVASLEVFESFPNKIHQNKNNTLPETNIDPEHGWLEDGFPFGARHIFRGKLLVLGSVVIVCLHSPSNHSGTWHHAQ